MMTLVLSSLLFFQGCSNGKTPEPVNDAKIHGTVTLNEKPIGPIALVLYSDHFGRIGEVQVDDKGTIQMESPVPSGGYMIALGKPREGSIPSGIPDAYFVETSSNLHVVLAKGDNELNLKLTK